eukprot:GHVS01036480.1.p1 GENE.GHVS01036480.1~~GHVS01036480.1.p1  ORF type:complete len:294 (+),score=30.90 GHVS01036480.1:227-1108(+)
MGLKCFVCGPLAALVICLITACLADTSLRSTVRQLCLADRLLTHINVNNVGKTEWISLISPVAVMVEEYSKEGEFTATVRENKISWNTHKGKTAVVNGEGLNASSISEEETDEAIGKRLARNIEYLVEQGHHNFRFDESVRVDVLLPCLEAMDVPSTTPNINITAKMFLALAAIGWLKKAEFFDKYVVVRKEKDDFSGSTYLVYNDKDTPDHNRFDFKGTFEQYNVEVYFLKVGQKFIYYEENGNLREKKTLARREKERDWITVNPKGGVSKEVGWKQVSKVDGGSQKPKDGK